MSDRARRSGKKASSRSSRSPRGSFNLARKLLLVFLTLALLFAGYVIYLDFTVVKQFSGKRWSVPARVYARPLELYVGAPLSVNEFQQELRIAAYRASDNRKLTRGSYLQQGNRFYLVTRPFVFWDGKQPPRYVEVVIEDDFITAVRDYRDRADIDIVRLEPAVMGRIYPAHHEDRILVKLNEVPEVLLKALITIEDRQFYEHLGVNPGAILRASLANIRAGKIVQGGSTLTQQLVKNFYLSRQRSLWRKFNEAIMSVLLELHYDKNDILESYLNEIYLGQDARRAIHGIGLASRFYFQRSVHELELEQSATLVALIRGPVYYNPWKHPQRLLQRRNHVLDVMQQQGVISSELARRAQQQPLSVIARSDSSTTQYPAFMDVVRRHLQRDYRTDDLSSEGLQIFTTFDPRIQGIAEKVVQQRIPQLQKQARLSGELQSAVLVTRASNAELLAVVGDRHPRYAGFNRALDASRQIGSLMKPAVYLSAVSQSTKYSLASLVEDRPITLKTPSGDTWSPDNYSGQSHGSITLADALIHSYNQATVRLGMQLGYEPIARTVAGLGVETKLPPYPAMMLGAVNMSPYEVTQMYQTLANEGLITPLKVIREVLTANGEPLRRYGLSINQKIDARNVRVINSALQEITRQGTARSLKWLLPEGLSVAGKTGTTNDTRDSWFAGFSGEHVIVSWLGTDDNRSTHLTGSSGALRIWADIMKQLRTRPLDNLPGEDLSYHYTDLLSGRLSREGCNNSAYLAYIPGSEPQQRAECD